jgi:hypothetical protein
MICKCGHVEERHCLGDYGRVWPCISCHNDLGNEHKFKADNLKYLELMSKERS